VTRGERGIKKKLQTKTKGYHREKWNLRKARLYSNLKMIAGKSGIKNVP
jgi:hypothetical protein